VSENERRTLVVLQPGYLPWLGFFDQMYCSDLFVYYDDVQFDKHGWRNRNRIKTAAGARWLSVPVRHHGLAKPRIMDIEIDNRMPWARKHLGSIRQNYTRAPHLETYWRELAELLQRPWVRLVDLNLAVTERMCAWLNIRRKVLRSSELGIRGERSERLLHLCLELGATRYLSGSAARAYLDVALFDRYHIEVQWHDYVHPVYPQQHGAFIPYLSALDLLLNCGPAASSILTARRGQGES